MSNQETAERLRTDPVQGLGAGEVERRRREHGPNRLKETAVRSRWVILAAQFKSLIVLLLGVAAAVAFLTGDRLEGASVVVVILLNAFIGFFTEAKAERAIASLQKQASPTAHVVREGQKAQVPAEDLVPGDRVLLSAGDRVPADGRLLEQAGLQVEEAALTGESRAVDKSADPIPEDNPPLGDRRNMVYLGTAVTKGRGVLLVTGTGPHTEMGRIGRLIEGAKRETTPLQKQLHQLGRSLIAVVIVLCAVVAVAGRLRGHEWLEMFKVAVSLAVAAVPEGLPAVATVTLAIGVQRMARQRALIRHLGAVETLGATTVICTDKTGTLTRNEMMVAAYALDERRIEVTGSGYETKGEFRVGDEAVAVESDAALALALRIGALCNDARIERKKGEVKVLGDPTEAALLVAAEKAGLELERLRADYPRKEEVPFSSETKLMATIHETPEGAVAYVKGAPSVILERSASELAGKRIEPLNESARGRWLRRNEELAGKALRVLALACRDLPSAGDKEEAQRDLTFVGFVGMIDPLRPEATEAIQRCQAAGMRVIMLTGDQPATATEIGRKLGLGGEKKGHGPVNAQELDKAGGRDWDQLVAEATVFARVNPEHKLRIVEALQQRHQVVAMTGDGVNDAPALKKADIGAAMGIKGTDVAKETADMVITDDNFASIVSAVEQGRIIHGNIRKFIHYLFSCNLSEILTVFVALIAGWPLPLVPLQILWLNLITDIFPALALAFEPASGQEMRQPPRDPSEKLVNRNFAGAILWQGVLLAAATLTAFRLGLRDADEAKAITLAFMTLALAQTLHAFNSRSVDDSLFDHRFFKNPWLWLALSLCLALQAAAAFTPFLRRVLQVASPSPGDWAIVLACSVTPVAVVEIVKFVRRRISGRRTTRIGSSGEKPPEAEG